MDNPVPSWHKTIVDGDKLVMDLVNPAYTAYTGISADAYRGQKDSALWSREASDRFNGNDLEVRRTRNRVAIAEPADNPVTGVPEVWVGWKWPRFDSEGKVIGIWGKAIPYPRALWDAIQDKHPYFASYNDGDYRERK